MDTSPETATAASAADDIRSSTQSPIPTDSRNPPETAGKRKREEDGVGEGGGGDASAAEDKSSVNHPLYKTSLCKYLRTHSGVCSHGDSCRFAHTEEELRVKPDGSWDPSSERARKAMKAENGEKKVRVDGEKEDKSVMMSEALLADGGDPQLSKCLVHLPRKWSSDQLRSFLGEQAVAFKSAKKKNGMTVGFVSFETAEQVKSAIEVLAGKAVGNKTIKIADVVPRSYDHKIKAARSEQLGFKPGSGEDIAEALTEEFENGDENDVSGSKLKSARDVVTPLAHMRYPEQLEHKTNTLKQTLKRLTRNARKACPSGVSLPEWILKSWEIGGLPCNLEGIIESPLINGYRNKCEFSVGYSVQGKPTVGFMLGNFREGVTAVEEPVDCPNVSQIACKYALIFQEFLQVSALPIWNRFNNTGFWRQLTVREGRSLRKGTVVENSESNILEVMLMVQICSSDVDVDIMNEELVKMREAFSDNAASSSPPLPLTVLAVQDHKGISNVAPADAPLRFLRISHDQSDASADANDIDVESYIHDSISNLRFRISPTAFFQVNTLAAEKLYSLAGDWAGLGPKTLLFDICCGTGTIGLTLAQRVGMVVGIEMNASAVADAQRNAEINGITNCRFVCSKAEDVMGSLLKEYLNDSMQQNENVSSSEINKTVNPDTKGESNSDKGLDSELCSDKEVELENASVSTGNDGEETQDHATNVLPEGEGLHMKNQFEDVVAIVDPPRMGLHPVVIKALRTHPRLRRLVYISCNPETMVANAIELCTPSSEKGEKQKRRNYGWKGMSNAGLARQRAKSMPNSEPFRPVKAMAVDLFPHTPHCELVMLLER